VSVLGKRHLIVSTTTAETEVYNSTIASVALAGYAA